MPYQCLPIAPSASPATLAPSPKDYPLCPPLSITFTFTYSFTYSFTFTYTCSFPLPFPIPYTWGTRHDATTALWTDSTSLPQN